jgi:hypothetical protein
MLCGPFILKAQDCNLPAPASLWANSVTATSIDLEWTPVAGVNVYHVTTIDVATNTVFSVETVNGTLHTVHNLSPATEYEFIIRSVCDEGSVSNNPSEPLRVSTGIIIVDIIAQLDCPNPGQTTTPYDPNSSYDYHFGTSNVLVLEGDVPALGPDPFYLVFENGINPQTNAARFTTGTNAALQSTLPISTRGNSVTVNYSRTNKNGTNTTHLMTAIISSTKVTVDWQTTGDVKVSKCDSATFLNGGTPGGRAGLGTNGGSDNGSDKGNSSSIHGLVIAPNPTSGVFTIDTPMDSTMDIYDSQGRPWYQGEVQYGERLQIDASNWPAGIYFIRTIENSTPKIQRFIKL